LNIKGSRDLPIETEEQDLFGLENYYRGLADFINNCETPMTIAIQGDWGSGKTSMMNNIKSRLTKQNNKHKVIWFDTWQYSQFSDETDLTTAFLNSITDEIVSNLSGKSRVVDTLKEAFINIIKKTHVRASCGFGNVLAAEYDDILERVLNIERNYYDGIKVFKERFKKAVDELIGKENKKVVIFIDDLDRLNPVRAVELLEIIKIFLDVKGCVFILAIDYEVVTLGVSKKYGENLMFQKGKSFFDKMIQLPFQIPASFYKMDKLLQDSFERMGIEFENDSHMVGLIKHSIGTNPRTVKRLLNTFELLRDILNLTSNENAGRTNLYLLFILIIQLYDEPLYKYLINNSEWAVIDTKENTIFSFAANEMHASYVEFLCDKLEINDEQKRFHDFKRTQSLVNTLYHFLNEEEVTKDTNIELLQNLLQQSQVTSSASATNTYFTTVQLTPDLDLSHLIIKGLSIKGYDEFPASSFTEVFIRILETLVHHPRSKHAKKRHLLYRKQQGVVKDGKEICCGVERRRACISERVYQERESIWIPA